MSGGFSYRLMQWSQRARESHEGAGGAWGGCGSGGGGKGQLAEHLAGIWDDERESQETQWPTSSCFSAFNVSLGHQRNGDTWLPSPNGSHMRSEGGWGEELGVAGGLLRPLPPHFLSVTFFHLHLILQLPLMIFSPFFFFIFILCAIICRKCPVLCKVCFSLLLTWICSSQMI